MPDTCTCQDVFGSSDDAECLPSPLALYTQMKMRTKHSTPERADTTSYPIRPHSDIRTQRVVAQRIRVQSFFRLPETSSRASLTLAAAERRFTAPEQVNLRIGLSWFWELSRGDVSLRHLQLLSGWGWLRLPRSVFSFFAGSDLLDLPKKRYLQLPAVRMTCRHHALAVPAAESASQKKKCQPSKPPPSADFIC